MLLAKILVTTSVAFFSIVSAITRNITVYEFNFGNFSKPNIPVPPGDTLRFIFTTVANRSVTESTLDKPCSPKDGGIDSGLMRSPHIYLLKVNDSNPIWLYSRNNSQYDVCREKSMAFAVNPGKDEDAFFDNIRNIRNNDSIPVSDSSCSGVKSPIQKVIAVVALFAGLLVV